MLIVLATAHPDDAEIYAGGMIAAWVAAGARVRVLVATDGAKGGPGDASLLAATRAKEARAGAAALGAEVELMGFPDGTLSECHAYPASLAARFGDLRPDLVLAHAANDYHADHRAVAVATARAASFAVPVATLDTMMGTGFVPTHWVDTTAHQAVKEAAILCHQTQGPDRFVERARLLGRCRSAQCGQNGFAEAIRFDPVYPFADIRVLLPPPPRLNPVQDRSRNAEPDPSPSNGPASTPS
jgi:N-acetylglucosamine malate deacetylase 1